MQAFRRLLAALACVVVGGASFALSYVALRDVAVSTGAVPAELGWLVPIVIDGGVICGSAVIWSLSKEEQGRPLFPFLFVAALVTMSVVVNVNHAGPSLLAKTIAALPPLILLGTLELVAAQGRRLGVPVVSATTATVSMRERLSHIGEVAAPVPAMAFDGMPATREVETPAAPVPAAMTSASKSTARRTSASRTTAERPAERPSTTGARRPTRVRAQAAAETE